MHTLSIVLLVIVVVVLILFFLSKKGDGVDEESLVDDRQEDDQQYFKANYLAQVFDKQEESVPQRGEEEFQEIKVQQETTLPYPYVEKEGASEELTKQVEEVLQKQEVKAQKTLEEKLAFTYYFHSKDFVNAHRYSVAGKFVKVEEKELVDYPTGYKLVLAYAVVGDADKFSRTKGREIAEANLLDCTKQYEYPVTQEELETPGRTFGDYAKRYVPFTVLTSEKRHQLRQFYTNLDNWIVPKNSSEQSKKEFDNYLSTLKAAPHRLLVAEVEVTQCTVCGGYELEVVEVNVQVEDCQESTESSPEAHTEQGL